MVVDGERVYAVEQVISHVGINEDCENEEEAEQEDNRINRQVLSRPSVSTRMI